MSNRQLPTRAASAVEMMVYGLLALFLFAGVLACYRSIREFYQGAVGSYLINSEFEPGLHFLRRELKETSLLSMRAYPNPQVTQALPGFSFVSARDYDEPTRFEVSPHGAPAWSKHIFYTFQPKDAKSGSIVRWEKKLPALSFMPVASLELPQALGGATHSKTMFKSILAPRAQVSGLEVDEHGGLQLRFLAYDQGKEILLEQLPEARAGRDPRRVIQIDLKGFSHNPSGQVNAFWVHFRVYPRHN